MAATPAKDRLRVHLMEEMLQDPQAFMKQLHTGWTFLLLHLMPFLLNGTMRHSPPVPVPFIKKLWAGFPLVPSIVRELLARIYRKINAQPLPAVSREEQALTEELKSHFGRPSGARGSFSRTSLIPLEPTMGIVLRQSLSNSFSSYAGLAIGALNTLVLYPLAFMPEHTAYYGLVQLLLNYTLIISMFTGLGMPQVLIRFYKRLEEAVRGHLTFFALLVPLFILLPLAAAILFLFREPLAHWLTQNPEDELLLFRYFPLLTITVLFNVYFEVLASISQVHLRSVLPMFLKEVGRRSVVTVLIGLLLMEWIDLHSFIWLFALLYPIQLIVLAFVLIRRKRIQFSWGWRPLPFDLFWILVCSVF